MTEEIKYDPSSGRNLSNGTWEYKVPLSKDIPIDIRINFLRDKPNLKGVLGSKTLGEPPLVLSLCTFFSVRNAIEAARKELGITGFFALNSPLTVEQVQRACQVNHAQFKLKDSVNKK